MEADMVIGREVPGADIALPSTRVIRVSFAIELPAGNAEVPGFRSTASVLSASKKHSEILK
jgi:hypothetical protein